MLLAGICCSYGQQRHIRGHMTADDGESVVYDVVIASLPDSIPVTGMSFHEPQFDFGFSFQGECLAVISSLGYVPFMAVIPAGESLDIGSVSLTGKYG